jgi:hypothetical protein
MEDVIFFIKSLTEHNSSLILMNRKKKKFEASMPLKQFREFGFSSFVRNI